MCSELTEPSGIITKCTNLFVLLFAISQAGGIAAGTLTGMQGSEKKKRTQRESNLTWQTRALTATSQKRRCEIVQVWYLTRLNEKKSNRF